ncbi:hypothetical protein GCM10010156_35080 [Planobispora rosea]|uniref:Uncharacterized protein n=1 Tax=Planobispora rosea TaxID=35762 RepID=A0A8J3WDI2_PLARO|nr:hypothetical protein [Planobispora rosea]GGS73120.1 hypothetical protein GCM10010156_35080 [Planobispora rosea]GIH85370.1 hypothetical protein Pro02_37780 [Planobispora rosea]
MEWGRAMRELSTAIDHLAAEDPSEISRLQLAEQLIELHWQMARLQAQIARRTSVRAPGYPSGQRHTA